LEGEEMWEKVFRRSVMRNCVADEFAFNNVIMFFDRFKDKKIL
jgi:hypothetical protein